MPEIWKYHVARALRSQDNQAEQKLNELGQEGWELVAVDFHEIGYWTLFLKQQQGYVLDKPRLRLPSQP
jgi:hypothetical protein